MSRFLLLVAGSLALIWSSPAPAAQYEKSGDWVFHSAAVATDGEAVLNACSVSTDSDDGTELTFRLEPVPDQMFEASVGFQNPAWKLAPPPNYVRLDIGGRVWVMPAEGGDTEVGMNWDGDAILLPLLEDLASGREAVLKARDGDAIARFSLSGSRGAIEAMKRCLEDQIVGTLDDAFPEGATRSAENPF